jgi:HD-GYP domain-containing protein (c-di-GMP phosphodiesterase class II)
VRLAEVIGTLSLAADAGTGAPEDFGLRTATVAARLGAASGADAQTCSDAYYLALLRFAGCTSESDRAASVFGDEIGVGVTGFGTDWGNPREAVSMVMRHVRKDKGAIGGAIAMMRTLARMPGMKVMQLSHCEVAVLMAERFGFDKSVQRALFQHQERWDGSGGPEGAKGDAIALAMRIAQAASDIETGHRLGGIEGARARTKRLAGRAIDPALVESFEKAASTICASVETASGWQAAMDAEPEPRRMIEATQIDEALRAVGDFADMKSNYTRGHSTAVSRLAEAAAKELGLGEDVARDLRRAGLVHDLGRVAVTAAIWDKPAALTEGEREKVRLHTYVTERVLSRAASLAPFAEIACAAHERLDAGGYHRRLGGNACTAPSRVLAAADVYVALTETRPHRPARSAEEAAVELKTMTPTQLCADAVRGVLAAAGHGSTRVTRPAGLTEREVDVLRLLARGLTNKEIANELDISTKTAGHHVQHIFEKFGVTTRAAAAMCAMQKGFVP